LWLVDINQLRLDWSTNPQYSYGWLVPFLTAYLIWNRRPSRPRAAAPAHPAWGLAGAVLLAFLLLPTRLVGEATPEWAVVRWTLTLMAVGLTLLAIYHTGGAAMMRHFAWPVCFFLVAVAWPVSLETGLTQSLMHQLARLTAELLGWSGNPARADGNLIHLGTGVLGVDEACSGVRSLQSMLMASLFLGELHRFSTSLRLALVAAGLAIALFFNLVRALLLSSLAIAKGIPAISGWHDPAGFSILAVSFGVLCLLVWFIRRGKPEPSTEEPAATTWRTVPRWALAGFAGWLVFSEVATEVWYRAHESGAARAPAWSVRWPEKHPEFHEHPITQTVSQALAYNEGRQATWEEPDGTQWQMYAFRWYPGRTSTVAARQHRPEVCLPAAGRTFVEEHAPVVIQGGTAEIPFRTYEFRNQGQPLFVFFCLWETGHRDAAASGLGQGYTRRNLLERVRIGQRNLGQQSVEVIVSGAASPEAATAAFQRLAPELIQAGS
ncbi:MAG TPA: exosortase/archaeosortase family protein, partial [Chthoniobacteraceae bacterium]|nr:exosortase/archaeosortase family protein [Chthoniobacteraceae bacterium]